MSIFMQFQGVAGEAADARHQGWIDVDRLQWGTARSVTSATSTRGDRESSVAEFSELRLTRHVDSASPKLFIEACCGTGNTIILHVTKTGPGDGAETFLEYTLKDALISNYKIAACASSPYRPVERLSISYAELSLRYAQYDEMGALIAPLAVGFSPATNLML